MLEKLHRLDMETFRIACVALGVKDVLGQTRHTLYKHIREMLLGNRLIDLDLVNRVEASFPSIRPLIRDIIDYIQAFQRGDSLHNRIILRNERNEIARGDLVYGYVWNNALCDDFGNVLYPIQPYFMRKYALRNGTYIGAQIKRGEFYELKIIEAVRAKRFEYSPLWDEQQKKTPDDYYLMPMQGLPVARGGLTVITGDNREKMLANITFYLRFNELYAVHTEEKPEVRKHACWAMSAATEEFAHFAYERAVRRAEQGLDVIVCCDNNGKLPLCPYHGVTTQNGSVTLLVTSEKPLAYQDTLIATTDAPDLCPEVIDFDNSRSELPDDPGFPLMRWINNYEKAKGAEPWRELDYRLWRQNNKD